MMKYGILVVVALYLLPRIHLALHHPYRKINVTLFLFLLTILYTGYVGNANTFIERNVFLAAIVYAATVFEAFLLFQRLGRMGVMGRAVNILYGLTFFYVVVTDYLLLTAPSLFAEYKLYFVGTKFWVSYLHIQLITLFWARNISGDYRLSKRSIIKLSLLFAWSCYIAATVDCATGIVSCVILLLLLLLGKPLCNVLAKPLTSVVTLLVACAALLFGDTILNLPVTQIVVEKWLGRSLTLTGRTKIYANIVTLFPDSRIWTGYGHGSSYEVSMALVNSANTQNGLVDTILQYGVFGAVLLLALMYFVFQSGGVSQNKAFALPFVCLLYVYIVLASVEITLGLNFLVMLSVIAVILAGKGSATKQRVEDCHENEKGRRHYADRVRQLR